MKKKVSIKIEGKSYPIKFGYDAMEELGNYLGINSYDGTAAKIQVAVTSLAKNEKEGGSLPFETLNTIGYLVLSGITIENELSKGDIVDSLLNDIDVMKPIMEEFVNSIPKPKKAAAGQQKKTTPRKSR